jgi:hypothetical protein
MYRQGFRDAEVNAPARTDLCPGTFAHRDYNDGYDAGFNEMYWDAVRENERRNAPEPFSPFAAARVANEERRAALIAIGLCDRYELPNVPAVKRWAKSKGYYGAQGGWIYSFAHRPMTQGWGAFYHRFKFDILADVQAGTFKVGTPRK